jgi:hypothetical protein
MTSAAKVDPMFKLAALAMFVTFVDTIFVGEWFFATGNGRPPAEVLFGTSVAVVWLWLMFFVTVGLRRG